MSYEDLEKDGLIEKRPVSKEEIDDLIEIAHRDIVAAKNVASLDLDWALVIVYNSVCQILLALMYQKGFRPKGEAKHKVVIDFSRISLGKEYKDQLDRIDKMRKKRNRAIYGHAHIVSELEAKESIKFCKEFIEKIIREKLVK
jgi:uncharacterized protein (UPF0332 family)